MDADSLLQRGIGTLRDAVGRYGVGPGVRWWLGAAANQLLYDVEGRSIFEEEWDLCVVLDACRADELERRTGSFPWLDEVGRFPSIASCTWNWLPRTMETTPDEVLRDTTYVCANPFSDRFCSDDQFHALDEVWRYAWDDERGTVLPRPVTDRAVAHGRSTDSDRLVVHYMQPHVPFLSDDATDISRSNFDLDASSAADDWDRVARGDLSRSTAISWYRETLDAVLEEVDLLLSNVDADRVVVTSDHGEAFGEWGLYGHPSDIALPCLTQVPWVETTATDRGTHAPDEYSRDAGETGRAERFRALGYRTS